MCIHRLKAWLTVTFLLTFVFFSTSVVAQITIGTIDQGPYGTGSNITVPIKIPIAGTCLPQNNKFELFISDATGSFLAETKIGEYTGFFTTFINAIIPSGNPALISGDNYKLRIKISGDNSIIEYLGLIRLRTANMPAVKISPASAAQILGTDTYGYCGSSISDNQSIILTNESAATTAVSLTLKNELTNSVQIYAPGPVGFEINNIENSYYTATLTGTQNINGEVIKSIKSYLLLNSSPKVSIESTGDGFGCIDPASPHGTTISYSVNINSASGILNNYPGSTYRVSWGDGSSSDVFTHCQLIKQNGIISHTFTNSSCGQPPINLGNGNSVNNAFSVSVTTINPFCMSESNSAISYAKIYVKPIAKIAPGSKNGCTNTPMVFANGTTQGKNADCSETMQFQWYVDGVLVAPTTNLTHTFTSAGQYEVKLIAKNNVGICTPSEDKWMVCIQDKPTPSFTLPTNVGCAAPTPFSLTPTNTSVVTTPACLTTTPGYRWTVSPAIGVTYAGGTNAQSIAPTFNFSEAGNYTIQLSILTDGCGEIRSATQTVTINKPPSISLSSSTTLCNLGIYTFSTAKGPTQVKYGGNETTLDDVYLWEVVGGDYTFENGTSAASKYPSILFKEYKTYTIVAHVTNNCGTVRSAPQLITFAPAPVVNAGPDVLICNGASIDLNGTVTGGPVLSATWIGGTGTFSTDRTILNTTYTPSAAERNAGRVTLKLLAVTILDAPCNIIEDEIVISIQGINRITSAKAATICSGETLQYNPLSALTGSTFSWTAANPDGRATGFSSTGSGPIKDTILNGDATQSSEVIYSIYASVDNCTGPLFVFTVTIYPLPVATATAASATICSNTHTAIALASSGTGIKYIWTSSPIKGNVSGNTNPKSATNVTILNDILTNNTATDAVVRYSITPVSVSGCSSPPIIVDITVAPSITIAKAGADQILCNQESYVLNGNSPASGIGKWSVISGQTVAFENDMDPKSMVSGLHPGEVYIFQWAIIGNNGCISTDEVKITTFPNFITSFNQDKTEGCEPVIVKFTNTSSSLTTAQFKWDFGNGVTSSLPNPPDITFLPQANGKDTTYTITLISTTICAVQKITSSVFVKGKAVAAFSPDKTLGCSPMIVDFSNTSQGSNLVFTYDFGDGSPVIKTTSRDNIRHTYTVTKVTDFVVKMTASNDCTTDENSYIIRVSPNNIVPELVVNGNQLTGCAPFNVTFQNNTLGASSFTYDFGDGTSMHTSKAPEEVQHTFKNPGTYTVVVYASNGCSNASTSETIVVLEQPTAAFSANKTIGCSGILVKFTNHSVNGIRYLWDFGDGTTSTEFEPEHVFTGQGISYTVSLTAINAIGCPNTATSANLIQVVADPKSMFEVQPGNEQNAPNFTFNFSDISTGGAVSWKWDFGDGTTSALQNPSHTYSNTKSYTVTLTVLNKEGCSGTSIQAIHILEVPSSLNLPNSFMPGSQNNEVRTFKAKGRGIAEWHMTIFNKWGQVLWETTQLTAGSPSESWDGTFKGQPQPQGTYFWKIDVKFINGSLWKGVSLDGSPPKKTGIIYLIR